MRDIKEYQDLAGDVKVKVDIDGGFTFVHLYDIDDYDYFLLSEDAIVALHKLLTKVIEENKL